jgi:hypothetical protein
MFYIFSFGFDLKHYFIVENFHEKKKTKIKINKAKTMFTGRRPPTNPSKAPRRQFIKTGSV